MSTRTHVPYGRNADGSPHMVRLPVDYTGFMRGLARGLASAMAAATALAILAPTAAPAPPVQRCSVISAGNFNPCATLDTTQVTTR